MALSDAAGGPPTVALCMSFEPHPGSRPGPAKLFEATTRQEWLESSATVQIRGPGPPAALINLSPVCQHWHSACSARAAAHRDGLQCFDFKRSLQLPPVFTWTISALKAIGCWSCDACVGRHQRRAA